MKKCKSCQMEIDDKAKKCPHCQTDQRTWFAKHKIISGALIVLFITLIANSGGKNTKEQTNLSNSQSTPAGEIQGDSTEENTKPTNIIQPTKGETVKKEEKKLSGVTMDQFVRIKEGMTYNEVVAILGSDGELTSSNELAGYKTVLYTWAGASFASNMNAMFQNDKMISKAQFGLK